MSVSSSRPVGREPSSQPPPSSDRPSSSRRRSAAASIDGSVNMSSVVQPDFPRLIPFGARRDYVAWARNVENYLARNNLSDAIVSCSGCSNQLNAEALFYIRRHLNETFNNEYMFERDPLVVWQSLKDHFDRMKEIELPFAKLDWDRLHFSNFDSVTAYDSALRRIVCQLKLCDKETTDEEMIEKTLSTFPPSQSIRHQMHRLANYGKYSELIFMLLQEERQEERDREELMTNQNVKPAQRVSFKRKKRRGQSGRLN